ncbi:Serine/threonine-protein kinase hal4 [Hypsizygus marmoreus]|uniref:non-specific serine/threonine protein kinase n=1 Tax=Hypsizygus marmoreus TaxID=39966 RepID=A0A369JQS3_HYPMA|nr:Serine/threonine-protein kinase hal4 [Hypsizygus marmoreus]
MAILDSSEETTMADGEGTDGPDKPPHGETTITNLSNNMQSAFNITPNTLATKTNTIPHVPLPPPETGTYDKQPGHTRSSLQKLAVSLTTSSNDKKPVSNASSASSPTASESGHSSPSTRPNSRPGSQPPSQAPSRAPSMSAGTSGGKVVVPPRKDNQKAATPSAAVAPVRPAKPASVHSESGSSHKFNLKDLLASGPKLNRKASQRSATSRSSRRSDEDAGSEKGGRTKSIGGDSTVSLSKKYGVCQKVAIGKGATSVVRLAHKWDRSEEKLYAVKEFRKRRKNETEKEYVKKLTAEFCISSTLHHPNIVETVDLVQDESQHWCEVMEFCPGGDLYAAIKKGGMSPSEVECCFKQILYGVEYLHSQGVAHRDIKPENLFFDVKGHLKIGDYGASTVYRLPWEATIHMSTGLCGSEPYIAPEQFLGKPYDARLVDIWACGIVYYCLHFQELPWRAAQPGTDALYASYAAACASALPAISACPPTINNLSPRACRPILRKMLEPDPRLRATIEDVIANSWVKGIEVCHEVKEPKHIHISAKALGSLYLNNNGT